MPIIAPVNLSVDETKLILHYRDLSCHVLDLPHTVTPLTHWRGHIFSMAGAAETQSHIRQMWPMNPLGDSRSYHGWSVWRPMNSLGFAKNISEWKLTEASSDALISYARVAKIAVTVNNLMVFCYGLGHVCYTSWEGMIKTFTIDSYHLRTTLEDIIQK